MVYNENNKYYLSKITTFLSDKQYIQGIGSKMKITSKNNNNNSKVKNNTRRTYLEKLLHNNITVFIEVMCFFLKNSKELKDEITYSSDLIEVNDEDLKKLISNDNTKLDIEGLKKILKYIESKKKENDIESKKKENDIKLNSDIIINLNYEETPATQQNTPAAQNNVFNGIIINKKNEKKIPKKHRKSSVTTSQTEVEQNINGNNSKQNDNGSNSKKRKVSSEQNTNDNNCTVKGGSSKKTKKK